MSNYNDSVPIKPNLTSSYKTSSTDRSRPLNAPKSQKDFKKIIDKPDLDEKEKEEIVEVNDQENPLPSLFELSGKNKVKKPLLKSPLTKDPSLLNKAPLTSEDAAIDPDAGEEALVNLDEPIKEPVDPKLTRRKQFEIPTTPLTGTEDDMIAYEDNPISSPTSNLSNLPKTTEEQVPVQKNKTEGQIHANPPEAQHNLKKATEDVRGREELVRGEGLHVQMEQPKDKTKLVRLSSEDPNLHPEERGQAQFAYLASLSNQQQLNADTGKAKEAGVDLSRSIAIRELIEKIVQSIQTIKKNDITETIVTLHFPPILEGSKLKLTAFDHAKNEFNIAFTDLSVAGKNFLDRKMAKDSLIDALDQKGYVVHIFSTTTQQDIAFNSNFENLDRERREQQSREGQQQGRGQRQQQENDEEERT